MAPKNSRLFNEWESSAKDKDPYKHIRYNWSKDDFKQRTDETVIVMFDFKFNKKQIFVDLGCGAGYICKQVAPYVKTYIGIDFSENMLKLAKKDNEQFINTNFLKNDGCTIPLEDKSVDVLISEQVFQHIMEDCQFRKESFSDATNYIKEVLRVVKSNGQICLQVPQQKKYGFGFTESDCKKLFPELDVEVYSEYYFYLVKNLTKAY